MRGKADLAFPLFLVEARLSISPENAILPLNLYHFAEYETPPSIPY
jgi:hypothetical protein